MLTKIVRTSMSAALLALCLGFTGCGDHAHAPVAPSSSTQSQPKAPLVHKAEIADWCPEHTVPESICTRCNTSLVPAFQAKGDWCKEHALPESQCFACHPELEAKFKAMAPKSSG